MTCRSRTFMDGAVSDTDATVLGFKDYVMAHIFIKSVGPKILKKILMKPKVKPNSHFYNPFSLLQ